jgi:hypothetical protein
MQRLNAGTGVLLDALNAIEWRLPLAFHGVSDALGAKKKRQGNEHDNCSAAHDHHGGYGVVRRLTKAEKHKQ